MADITGVTSLLATASETYTNNLSASISAGAGTVPVNANTEYTDGQVAVLTVDAGTASEATFTGIKASTPARFTNCIWTEGNTGVGHSSGATIVDYDSATHFNMLSTNVQAHANQDGTLKTSAVQAALNISAAVPEDYTALAQTMTTVVANGNRSYTGTFPAVDYSDRLSAGKRLRTVRSVAAPTQCATFDGTNDYFSKSSPAGMTFTDDFFVFGHIKPSAYQPGGLITRYNGTNGFITNVTTTGQLSISILGAGVQRSWTSYQSVVLNKWQHFVMTLNASASTGDVYIDGVLVPGVIANSGAGLASFTQAGNLEIGSWNASNFFAGKIAQIGVGTGIITQANARLLSSQGLTPALITSNNIISAYSLDNSLTDLNTTSANNLTANGGVLATTADSPFGGQADGTISTTVDYGIIQKVTYGAPDTTVTFQVPEGCTVPTSGGVASVSYSAYKSPYGFPGQTDKWIVESFINSLLFVGIGGAAFANPTTAKLNMPLGEWVGGYSIIGQFNPSVSAAVMVKATLSLTAGNSEIKAFTSGGEFGSTTAAFAVPITRERGVSTSAATDYFLNMYGNAAGNVYIRGDNGGCSIYAKNAYL